MSTAYLPRMLALLFVFGTLLTTPAQAATTCDPAAPSCPTNNVCDCVALPQAPCPPGQICPLTAISCQYQCVPETSGCDAATPCAAGLTCTAIQGRSGCFDTICITPIVHRWVCK